MPAAEKDAIIFSDGVNGYGYAVAPPDKPPGSTYHWSHNWDCRFPGHAVPSAAPIKLVSGFTGPGPVNAAFEWAEDSGALQFNGRPIILVALGNSNGAGAGAGAYLYHLVDGTYTAEGGAKLALSTSNLTGGVLYAHDGTAANNEAAFFCNGSTNDFIYRRKKDGTITQSAQVKADSLWSVGADLYGVGISTTTLNSAGAHHRIAKLSLGADPMLSASWVTDAPVGIPTYPITKVLPLAGGPCCIKPEGVYRFVNPDWIPIYQFVSPHPKNGEAAFYDGRGRIYVDTVDGDLIVVMLGYNSQQRPVRFTNVDRNTPFGKITAMTADGEFIYAAIEPGQQRTQQLGVTLQFFIGAVFTNQTSKVTDGLYSSVADAVAAFGAGDFIYIGANEPGFPYFVFQQGGRTAGATFAFQVAYSAGTGAFTDVTSTSADSTAMFCRDGAIVPMDATGSDLYSGGTGPWKPDTVNGIANKYWIRLGTAAGSTLGGAALCEVYWCPYRPPVGAADPNVQIWPVTGWGLMGGLPHILVGQWRREEIVWHDAWALQGSRIDQLVVGRAFYGGSTGKRALFAFNWQHVFAIPIGPDSWPVRASWPKIADYGEGPTSYSQHVLKCSGFDFGTRVRCTGSGLEIDAPYIQSDDQIQVIYWWDEDSPVYYWEGPESYRYLKMEKMEGSGRVLHVAIQFQQGQRRPVAPYIREIKLPSGSWVPESGEGFRSDVTSPQST